MCVVQFPFLVLALSMHYMYLATIRQNNEVTQPRRLAMVFQY